MITITIPSWLGRILRSVMPNTIEATWRCGCCGREINGDSDDAVRNHAKYFHGIDDIEIVRGATAVK